MFTQPGEPLPHLRLGLFHYLSIPSIANAAAASAASLHTAEVFKVIAALLWP